MCNHSFIRFQNCSVISREICFAVHVHCWMILHSFTHTAGPACLPGAGGGGTAFIRWGRTTCPDTPGVEKVHDGVVAGSYYTHGGAADYLCLPHKPVYFDENSEGVQSHGLLYGTEYEFSTAGPLYEYYQHNAPCAQCYIPRAIMMLPAAITCPENWTLEYNGYLVSAHKSHKRTRFICLDKDPESVPGSYGNVNGALLYVNEATCTGLLCPPYDTAKEVTCAVCSKWKPYAIEYVNNFGSLLQVQWGTVECNI